MGTNSKDKPGVVISPPLLYLGSIALGVALHFIYPITWRSDLDWKILGVILIAFSLFTMQWAARLMRNAGTNINPEKPTIAIIQTGPYRFSRNPLYLSMTLIQLGIAFILGSLWVIAMLLVVLVTMNWGVIQREERYLVRKFGEEYVLYQGRVRRWI